MDMQPYYYGQGKVYAGMRVNGVVKAMKWLLDVSNLDAEFQVEQKKHKESWSGQAATVVKLIAGKSASVTMTVMQRSADNLALVLHGTATKGVAGTVTGEQLPTGLAAGDRITLAHPSVTNLVLTDSAATPAPVDPSSTRWTRSTGPSRSRTSRAPHSPGRPRTPTAQPNRCPSSRRRSPSSSCATRASTWPTAGTP